MLEEAIGVIRQLWRGGRQSHHGKYFTIEYARIFTLPPAPSRIMIAASKPRAAELVGRCRDGLISFGPDRELVKRFEASGGRGRPRYGQVTVRYAQTKEEAAHIVRKYWPTAGIGGALLTDLASLVAF